MRPRKKDFCGAIRTTYRRPVENSVPVYQGEYVGTIPSLKGKTALIVRSGMGWKAQFDDVDAAYAGVNVAHNWHWFGKDNFEVLHKLGDFKKDTRYEP